MAFYPDELSPIDRLRNLGKLTDSLSDISAIKNRRQWKSLVLGKKDMGMNSFATIAEEKEEEISSDGSQSNKGSNSKLNISPAIVPNKKITFPKPRKYITSRLSDRKEDLLRNVGNASLGPLEAPTTKDFQEFGSETKKGDSIPDSKAVKSKKSKEFLSTTAEYMHNFALNQTPIENQWNHVIEDSYFGGFSKGLEKPGNKQETNLKWEGKRKCSDAPKVEMRKGSAKGKGNLSSKKQTKLGEKPSSRKEEKPPKVKQNVDKEKSLNMKEVVNVYKNLAYGSKEEIKSFVENLAFVQNQSQESDKNLLSVMNLKVLESKIKNFTKKGAKGSQTAPMSEEKKPKSGKPAKRNRKAHIERLARHKVVKVPAVSKKGEQSPSVGERQSKASSKEPWKYVGMESALDKTYFVYPVYPPLSVNLKKAAKPRKPAPKEKPAEKPASKVKSPQIVIRQNLFSRGVVGSTLNMIESNKSVNRPSATTVCTVEFRPADGRKPEEADGGLLVYLHGTKAINVKSPYSEKQFSRVKFFRKDERVAPLIKGFAPRAQLKSGSVSMRNVSLPDRLASVRSIDFLDFDEDIQNITDFLRSQESPSPPPEFPEVKKWLKSPDPRETSAIRQQRRPHHHQHGTASSLSPDSIFNEISKHVEHLQYLPDTEENRKLIGQFFDDLDLRIEASKNRAVALEKFPLPPVAGSNSFRPIPILGY